MPAASRTSKPGLAARNRARRGVSLCDPERAARIRRPEDLLDQVLIQSDNKQVRWPLWSTRRPLAISRSASRVDSSATPSPSAAAAMARKLRSSAETVMPLCDPERAARIRRPEDLLDQVLIQSDNKAQGRDEAAAGDLALGEQGRFERHAEPVGGGRDGELCAETVMPLCDPERAARIRRPEDLLDQVLIQSDNVGHVLREAAQGRDEAAAGDLALGEQGRFERHAEPGGAPRCGSSPAGSGRRWGSRCRTTSRDPRDVVPIWSSPA
jgi:hypothetical protein